MARVRSVSTQRRLPLDSGWTFAEARAGAARSPEEARSLGLEWLDAEVPGTVASSLRALGRYTEGDPKSFDDPDYWFHTTLGAAGLPEPGERAVLHFDGLATLADVWLDGELLFHAESMWMPHAVLVSDRLRAGSDIAIRFLSLDARLREKKPRPRYKTRLVRRQEIRFVRTTLLGRMPGWSPRGAPVGPYRPVWLEIGGPEITASMRTRIEGRDGVVDATFELQGMVANAHLRLGSNASELAIENRGDASILRGTVTVANVELWWPHTHGAQTLYEAKLVLTMDGREVEVDLGPVGFRSVAIDRAPAGRGFGVVVNGVPVFARGATFTPLDALSLGGSLQAYRAALMQVRRAGMNMIRLSGTLVYERDLLFDLCDELGILVWQDFMFANMDYPATDDFFATVRAETESLLGRIETSAALAVVAGGSEVAQQASMLGLDRSAWQPELFEHVLAAVTERVRPDVAYLPSTPWGGPLPFRPNTGVSHYYGVGAYERPLEDARRSEVRFAAECLAFSNVPSQRRVDALLAGGESPWHPIWKERVPRDHGSGWDFEDVRDHYVGRLFRIDTTRLRYVDPERYLALGRAVTGEVMASVFSEWRRSASTCRGGLVWLLRDLWSGAGFGLIDSNGAPKACYFALARVLQPVTILALDEGLNGARFIATNEGAEALSLRVEVAMYLASTEIRKATKAILVPARGEVEVDVEEVLEVFSDPTHAYRFGPPVCDTIVAKLLHGESPNVISTAFLFPIGYESSIDPALEIEAVGRTEPSGHLRVTVRSRRLALFVGIDVRGYTPDDDAFHIEPGGERSVRLTRDSVGSDLAPSGTVHALNAPRATRIRFDIEAKA